MLAVFSLALISSACKKETPPQVQNPAEKLRGKVELNGVYGGVVLEGRAGTQALLVGNFQNFNVSTDNSGRFEFGNVPDGTYSLTVSRADYVPATINNILFSKNSPALPVDGEYQIIPTVTLGRKSVSEFDTTTVNIMYNTEITFQDTVDGELVTIIDTLSSDIYFRSVRMEPETANPSAKFGYRLFMSKTPNPSPANNLRTVHGVLSGANTVVEQTWTQSEWQNFGFSKGDMVYIRIYGDAVNPIVYQNEGGQPTYPALSESFDGDAEMIEVY